MKMPLGTKNLTLRNRSVVERESKTECDEGVTGTSTGEANSPVPAEEEHLPEPISQEGQERNHK
jgi:hypothetical protein